jgi:hypothetical protein
MNDDVSRDNSLWSHRGYPSELYAINSIEWICFKCIDEIGFRVKVVTISAEISF